MFVFYLLQTICFALYSKYGNLAAAHTFIGMICKHSAVLARLATDQVLSKRSYLLRIL